VLCWCSNAVLRECVVPFAAHSAVFLTPRKQQITVSSWTNCPLSECKWVIEVTHFDIAPPPTFCILVGCLYVPITPFVSTFICSADWLVHNYHSIHFQSYLRIIVLVMSSASFTTQCEESFKWIISVYSYLRDFHSCSETAGHVKFSRTQKVTTEMLCIRNHNVQSVWRSKISVIRTMLCPPWKKLS
jgi:hypothetical protein